MHVLIAMTTTILQLFCFFIIIYFIVCLSVSLSLSHTLLDAGCSLLNDSNGWVMVWALSVIRIAQSAHFISIFTFQLVSCCNTHDMLFHDDIVMRWSHKYSLHMTIFIAPVNPNCGTHQLQFHEWKSFYQLRMKRLLFMDVWRAPVYLVSPGGPVVWEY